MTSEEKKKKWLKNSNSIFYLCTSNSCDGCPFKGQNYQACTLSGDAKELLKEAWPETNEYSSVENPVNPDHYKAGKLETIEQMIIMFGPKEVAAFCKINAFKYQARAGLKGDALTDHQKADWYTRLYRALHHCKSTRDGLRSWRTFKKEEENHEDVAMS